MGEVGWQAWVAVVQAPMESAATNEMRGAPKDLMTTLHLLV